MKQMTLFYRMILRVALAASLTVSVRPANAVASDEPSGTWLTEDGRARIRIERCGAKLEQVCGYIVWMKEPMDPKGRAVLDVQNSGFRKALPSGAGSPAHHGPRAERRRALPRPDL